MLIYVFLHADPNYAIIFYRNYLPRYQCFSGHLAYPGKKPTPILLSMMNIWLSRYYESKGILTQLRSSFFNFSINFEKIYFKVWYVKKATFRKTQN